MTLVTFCQGCILCLIFFAGNLADCSFALLHLQELEDKLYPGEDRPPHIMRSKWVFTIIQMVRVVHQSYIVLPNQIVGRNLQIVGLICPSVPKRKLTDTKSK